MKGSPIAALANVKTLVLAAGHGAADSGAVHGPHTERAQTIVIVDRIAALLKAAGIGIGTVVVSPHAHDTHQTIPWVNRNWRMGEAWALEIHRDSASTIREPSASTRCGIYCGTSVVSTMIAETMLPIMRQAGADKSSWVRKHTASRHGSLGWIRQINCLSHLVELGFMEGNNSLGHLDWLASVAARSIAYTFAGISLP